MLKFRLRTTTERPPSGYLALIGMSSGGLATVSADGTVTAVQGGGSVTVTSDWASITGKPSGYTPSAHTHEMSEINGLSAALASISSGGISDGSKGDVTVSGSGTVWSIATFAGSAKGLVPSSSGGTTNFLRADGTWAAPSSSGGVSDGNKGDITVASSGTSWTINAGSVTLADMAAVAAQSFIGNSSISSTTPAALTVAQARTLLGLATVATSGSAADLTGNLDVARLNGGTGASSTTFWRGDGVWATPSAGGVSDGDKGDVTVSSSGTVWTVDSGAITNAKLANVATATFKGRTTAGSGAPEDLTATQATALLNTFTSSLKGLAPSSGGGTTNFLRADGTWAAPPSGSDPWTYIKLSSDFITSSSTAVDITGLAFTPAANTTYEFECVLMVRTATTTVGPRPGVAWPTGGTDGVSDIFVPSSATAQLLAYGNINAAVLAPVGGLPNTTQSWPARIRGMFVAGATPSGTVKMQLASETAGTNVTAVKGSFLKYRTI